MDDQISMFQRELQERVRRLGLSDELKKLSFDWMNSTAPFKYTYNFSWLGLPVIQYPQDLMAMQEIIWSVKPDLIIETGIAHGGSLVFYASMLQLIGGDGKVVGIDREIRPHNRQAITAHDLNGRITMIEGSSTDEGVVRAVSNLASAAQVVLVVLDSNHTHEHVLAELRAYSTLVTRGSYLVVFDTVVEFMPEDSFPDRPWGRGNNPWTAVEQFLAENQRFEVDRAVEDKLLITVAPGGYLRCIAD